MVILIQYIDVLYSLDMPINLQLVDLFNTQLDKIDSVKLEKHLSVEEIQHFTELIEETKYVLNKM